MVHFCSIKFFKFAEQKGIDVNSNLYLKLTSSVSIAEHKHSTSINGVNFSQTEKYKYIYDDELRLKRREYSSGNLPLQVVEFTYDDLGQLKVKKLKEVSTLRQSINYKYNIRGWLTEINDPDNYTTSGDFLAMKLFYEKELDPNIVTSTRYNGNISGIKWITSPPKGITTPELSGKKGYAFFYDELNRLITSGYLEETAGKLQRNDRYLEHIRGYDRNGNILNLKRYGVNYSDSQLPLDELTYHYAGNKVTAIDDSNPLNNGNDFCDNGHYYYMGTDTLEYFYDANGNLTKDVNKGIINITYNEMNLPVIIEKTGNYRLEYEYDALGNKLRQLELRNGKLYKTTDFVANFVYERNYPAWHNFDEGRVVYNTNVSYFAETYIKDHLGNVRVAFGNDGSGFGVRQVNAYYPFGMSIRTLSSNSANTTHRNEYGYNGKMYQDEMGLNWYDYGARFYDPVMGRWWSIDPLAEQYRRWTPYNYCIDNPMRFVDPDGMWPWEAKNVRNARQEGRRVGIKPAIWKSDNDGRKWASVEYGSTNNPTEGAYSKVFKPAGKSWAESYQENIGKHVQDGSNDLANSGGTTAEGWKGTLKLLNVMAAVGSLGSASTISAGIFEGINVINSIDEACSNDKGESLIEQNVDSQKVKETISNVKEDFSNASKMKSILDIKETIKNPFSLFSFTYDMINTESKTGTNDTKD